MRRGRGLMMSLGIVDAEADEREGECDRCGEWGGEPMVAGILADAAVDGLMS